MEMRFLFESLRIDLLMVLALKPQKSFPEHYNIDKQIHFGIQLQEFEYYYHTQ